MHNKGFTLIEAAITILLVGILTTGLLEIFLSRFAQHQLDSTDKKLQEIKKSLIGFAIIYQRLPYPDRDNDGLEDTDFDCDTEDDGWLPWATLGVERTDGWYNPFFYRLDRNYCHGYIPNPPHTSHFFRIDEVINGSNYSLTGGDYPPSNSRVIAIVLSCGASGLDSSKTRPPLCKTNDMYEQENSDRDTQYMSNDFVEGQFDDRIMWLSKNTLLNYMVKAGR